MVFHLPNEDSLRTTKSYSQMFLLTLVWNIGLLGMLITFLFIVFFILKKYMIKMRQNEQLKDSIITQQERTSRHVLTQREDGTDELISEVVTVNKVKNPTTTSFRIVNIITSVFFYLFWVVAALFYLAFYMLNTFGRGMHIDVLSVFAMTCAVVIPTLIWKYYTKVSQFSQARGEVCLTVFLLIVWLGLCVFGVIATKGMCVCFFNDVYGFKLNDQDISLSSDFSRLMTLNQTCADLQVCRLYATLPPDSATSVFFNAHTGLDISNLTFILKNGSTPINTQISDQPFKLDNVESVGQRYIHSVLMTDLKADSRYSLEIYDSKTGFFLKKIGYKTVPGADAETVRIAEGGDLGMTTEGKLMTSYLKQFKPDVIVLGGDTVYDNALRSCYYNWDIFYSMFEPVYEELGRLVPLVMSVGNHDVGFDAFDDVAVPINNNDLPLFFVYNPQHLSHEGKGVPPVLQRNSYHYHLIGPTIMFNMDSGYMKSYSDQRAIVENIIKDYPSYYRFASYHNPIYPACSDPDPNSNDAMVIREGTKWWVPLFDKWNFTAVLEHHTHYRKISYPLKNTTRDDKYGTRYIGDGSWGVPNGTCSQHRTPNYTTTLLQQYSLKDPNHFWQITITKGTKTQEPFSINYKAISMGNEVVTNKVDILPPLPKTENVQ